MEDGKRERKWKGKGREVSKILQKKKRLPSKEVESKKQGVRVRKERDRRY